MQISPSLNLVIPVDRSDGTTIHVHSAPISRSVFESNYRLIARTFAAIHGQGLGAIAGPRVAALTLQELGREGEADLATPLLNEIRRLTNVVVPTDAGWDALPFDDACNRKLIDEEDAAEALNAIVFFIVGSAMYPKRARRASLEGAASLWGASLTFSSCTDLAASLKTPTPAASTGETVAPAPGTIIIQRQTAAS